MEAGIALLDEGGLPVDTPIAGIGRQPIIGLAGGTIHVRCAKPTIERANARPAPTGTECLMETTQRHLRIGHRDIPVSQSSPEQWQPPPPLRAANPSVSAAARPLR